MPGNVFEGVGFPPLLIVSAVSRCLQFTPRCNLVNVFKAFLKLVLKSRGQFTECLDIASIQSTWFSLICTRLNLIRFVLCGAFFVCWLSNNRLCNDPKKRTSGQLMIKKICAVWIVWYSDAMVTAANNKIRNHFWTSSVSLEPLPGSRNRFNS